MIGVSMVVSAEMEMMTLRRDVASNEIVGSNNISNRRTGTRVKVSH